MKLTYPTRLSLVRARLQIPPMPTPHVHGDPDLAMLEEAIEVNANGGSGGNPRSVWFKGAPAPSPSR